MNTTSLITLVKTYCAHTGKAEATVSNLCAGHARFFDRLQEGKGCTIRIAEQVFGWFAANWPADLEWPAGVARPQAPKREAA